MYVAMRYADLWTRGLASGRKFFVGGNWKCNGTVGQVEVRELELPRCVIHHFLYGGTTMCRAFL